CSLTSHDAQTAFREDAIVGWSVSPLDPTKAHIMGATSVQSESRHRSACVARELHNPNDVADKDVLGKALNRGIHPTAIFESEHGTALFDCKRDADFVAVIIP